MKRILIISDAAEPQVNGVVTTIKNLLKEGQRRNFEVHLFSGTNCKRHFSLPSYAEIELGIPSSIEINTTLNQNWDAVHIATLEGPCGYLFSKALKKRHLRFSASMHTKFPDIINAKFPFIPKKVIWNIKRKIYEQAESILTTTESIKKELLDLGFQAYIDTWTRGVDRDIFFPSAFTHTQSEKIALCVSRLSHEKGLDDFCSLQLPGFKKILVGDGPYRNTLQKRYPDVVFTGTKKDRELAQYYRNADVFIFPSKADTFGIVMIEALACGTPVVAYPVSGPIDIISDKVNGILTNNLSNGVHDAIELNRNSVYNSSYEWTWEKCWDIFYKNLVPIKD